MQCGFVNRDNELVVPFVFSTKMHGLFLFIDQEAEAWRKSQKFAKYWKAYQLQKE